MRKINKLLLALSAFSFCVVGGVSALNTSAQTEITSVNDVQLSMVEGAAIRYVSPTTDSEDDKAEVYKNNGIRFIVSLSKADYEGLEALQGTTYTDVSYGVLIAPADYGTLDEASVFGVGGDKQFDWAVWNAQKGGWEYSGDGTYTRITNITSQEMYWNAEESQYQWSGAITNLLDTNLARKFQGVGYVAYKTEENGTTNYLFTAENSVRSMAQVAQLVVDLPEYAEKAAGIREAYITPVTDVERTYTVEHYDEFGYLFATTTGKTTIDDTVTVSGDYSLSGTGNARRIVNGIFDVDNDKNVATIEKVYADDTYTLKKYYSNVIFSGEVTTSSNSSVGKTYPINCATETVKATFFYPAAVTETNDWKVSARWVIDDASATFIKRFDIKWTGSQLQFMLNDSAVFTVTAAFATTFKNALAGEGLDTYFTVNGKTLTWYFPVSTSAYGVTSFTTDNAAVTDATTTQIGITTTNCGVDGALITYDKLSESTDIADLGLTVTTTYSQTTSFACESGRTASTPAVTVSGSTQSVLIAQMKIAKGASNGEITASSWKLDLRANLSGYLSLANFVYDSTNDTLTVSARGSTSSVNSTAVSNIGYVMEQLQDSDGWTVMVVRNDTSYTVYVDDNGGLKALATYTATCTGEYKQIGIGYQTPPTNFIGDTLTVAWTLYANTTAIPSL